MNTRYLDIQYYQHISPEKECPSSGALIILYTANCPK